MIVLRVDYVVLFPASVICGWLAAALGIGMAVYGPRAIAALSDTTRKKLARATIVLSLSLIALGLCGGASLWLLRDLFEYAEQNAIRPVPTVPYRGLVMDL